MLIVSRIHEEDAVVVLSSKEYNSMTETQQFLFTNATRQELADSIQQTEKGELKTYNLQK